MIRTYAAGSHVSAWMNTRAAKPYMPCFNSKLLTGKPFQTGPRAGTTEAWLKSFHQLKAGSLPNMYDPSGRLTLFFGDSVNLFALSDGIEKHGVQVVGGAQVIHQDLSGSHTGGVSAHSVLQFPHIRAALVNHSEQIGENGVTPEIAAARLATAMKAELFNQTFRFVCLCIGEPGEFTAQGTQASADYVYAQTETILTRAKEQADIDPQRLVLAYEPRGAIQVGDVKGIPPTNEHILTSSWAALKAVSDVYSDAYLAQVLGLLYGGSAKPVGDATNGIDRFIGPSQQLGDNNPITGFLVGTATMGSREEPARPAADIANFLTSLEG